MNAQQVTLRWMTVRHVVLIVLIAGFCAALVGGVTAAVVQSQENKALRVNAISSCDGVNLIRGDARLLVHRLRPTYPNPHELADWLLRVRDCARTYDEQRIVLCPPGAEYRYLVALAHYHRVALKDRCTRLVPMG